MLPAFRAGMRNVSQDEQRHIGFGVKLLRDLSTEDPEVPEAVAELLRQVLPFTIGVFKPPNFDRPYSECFGFTLEEIFEEGASSFESKLRAAGLPLEELPGPVPYPIDLPPRERALRGMALLQSGILGEKNGPPARDPETMALLFDIVRRGVDFCLFMAGLRPEVVWTAGGQALEPRLLALLRAIERHATLKAAAEETRLSYRGAWGLLLEAARLAGSPLVELQRGRGARLTRLGAALLRNDERLRQAIAGLQAKFQLSPAAATSPPTPMRLAASHDPLLAEFCEHFAGPAGLIGEVSFRGSEDSLALFSRGAVEMAGFHLDGIDLRRHLRPRRDSLVRFAERDQGLMVPQAIRSAGQPRGRGAAACALRQPAEGLRYAAAH